MNTCKQNPPGKQGENNVLRLPVSANDNAPDPTEWDDMIMRLPEVLRVVGLSRSTIYRLIKEGKFPKSLRLTGSRAIGWRRGQIRAWLGGRRRG